MKKGTCRYFNGIQHEVCGCGGTIAFKAGGPLHCVAACDKCEWRMMS